MYDNTTADHRLHYKHTYYNTECTTRRTYNDTQLTALFISALRHSTHKCISDTSDPLIDGVMEWFEWCVVRVLLRPPPPPILLPRPVSRLWARFNRLCLSLNKAWHFNTHIHWAVVYNFRSRSYLNLMYSANFCRPLSVQKLVHPVVLSTYIQLSHYIHTHTHTMLTQFTTNTHTHTHTHTYIHTLWFLGLQ